MPLFLRSLVKSQGGVLKTLAEWICMGGTNRSGAVSIAVAGLTTITPASGLVSPMPVLFIGLNAGILGYLDVVGKNNMGYDDILDAGGIRGGGRT